MPALFKTALWCNSKEGFNCIKFILVPVTFIITIAFPAHDLCIDIEGDKIKALLYSCIKAAHVQLSAGI